MKARISIRDKYGPAMAITDQAKADAYFQECVEHTMSFGASRDEAERVERANFGYFAGYCDRETWERVMQLFKCAHPVFGTHYPDLSDAYKAGLARGVSTNLSQSTKNGVKTPEKSK